MMKKSIAIVIPAYNEEATIAQVIAKCYRALDKRTFDTAVFVVNDGSVDKTAELSEQAKATVVSHSSNMGVGKTFQTGLAAALKSKADIIANIDADGQFDPDDLPRLIQPLLDDRADFATASRFKDSKLVPVMPRSKLIGNHMMSRLISRIAGHRFYDVSCGFRAYNREAAMRLSLWGHFTYTQESILDLYIKGMRIEEVPMKIQGVRSSGESKVASNLWKYGTKSLKIILRTYLDYWPIHFFGWLSLPFLMLGSALVLFLVTHRITNGSFFPHIWAGFTGAALFSLGLIILITGLIGEMLKRMRLNQEMILYNQRKSHYESD